MKLIIGLILTMLLFSGCTALNYQKDDLLNNSTVPSKIIKKSVLPGDLAEDTRSPDEACNSKIQEVQISNRTLDCKLIDSKRIYAQNAREDCVDDWSTGAGCFACTFECK